MTHGAAYGTYPSTGGGLLKEIEMHTNHRRKNKRRTFNTRCRCTYCELGKAHAHKRREPLVDDVCVPLYPEMEPGSLGDESYWELMDYLERVAEFEGGLC